MAKAVALLSGGLDSTLAVLLLRRQGIEVTAITFLTHFGCDMGDKSSCSSDSTSNASKYGFSVKMSHLSDKFIDIVKNPRFGHGKNMNPCIDCRILMLTEAAEFMRMTGADFVSTGEVVGQRPMSQMKNTLNLIDKEAGLKGRVLRPLSAKILIPTIVEQEGIVDRERLMGFYGRSRRPQMALANEFGLSDYPPPAGGCLLTDPIYSYRLKELLAHNVNPSLDDIRLLKTGRHFRLKSGLKVVAGREEAENDFLESLCSSGYISMEAKHYGSPIVLIKTGSSAEDKLDAAGICARYCDGKNNPTVDIIVSDAGENYELTVAPLENAYIGSIRIEPSKGR